ncbi:MAG: DUF4215 domain-containing protein, partial [Myxococcales bacterium]|nr:DUF4215 domain-containing protein [Myxococcales bacterium]
MEVGMRRSGLVVGIFLAALSGCAGDDGREDPTATTGQTTNAWTTTSTSTSTGTEGSTGDTSGGSGDASSGTSTGSTDTTGSTGPETSGTTSSEPVCGDGVVEGDEECDDANQDDTDACLTSCLVATCGDGVVQAGVEDCDDAGESAACNDDCTASACGDGKVNQSAGEVCDGDVENGVCDDTCAGVVCADDYGDCDDVLGCETQLCGGTCDAIGPLPGMQVFGYTGQPQDFEVPACVESVTIKALGAAGGNSTVGPSSGGLGGEATGELMVTPGDVLHVYVGQKGANSSGSNASVAGSYNGG